MISLIVRCRIHAVEDGDAVFEVAFEQVKDCFKGGGYDFPVAFLDVAYGPMVYIFHAPGEVLYVGYSANGLKRPLSESHQERDRARAEATQLSIYPCKSAEDARKVEATLIFVLKPRYNINDKAGIEVMPQLLGVTRDSYKEVYPATLITKAS